MCSFLDGFSSSGALLFSACLSVRGRGRSNSEIFNRISTKWIVSIKLSFKFKYGFCPTKANRDGRQNGCLLSVSAVVVTLIWMSMNFKQNQPQTGVNCH